MGIYDVYCFICGNTNHEFKIEKDYYEKKENIKDKKILKDLKDFEKKTKWLKKITFLTSYDKIIHNVEADFYNFKDKNG
jgi:hypothetical protein